MEEDALLQRQRSGEQAGTSGASPFAAAAQHAPAPEQQTRGRAPAGSRLRGAKGGEPGAKRQASGQLRGTHKPGPSRAAGAEKAHSGAKPIARTSADPASRQPSGRLAAQKSAPHLQKVSTAAKAGRPGGMKRAVSVTELQPDGRGKAEPGEAAAPGPQRSAPRRLLQKLTFSAPPGADKGATRLPLLAPIERKILAAVGQRDWIKVDSKADASVFRRDKHAVTHELGIQVRDLRLLDPLMTSSYPSCLLVREKALIVNLEYIKCIVTTSFVLILDADQSAAKAFIQQLQARLRDGPEGGEESAATVLGLDRPSVGGPPFELRALETALDEVTKHLERLCGELELGVRPMLGTTTAGKVTSDYLERMRRMKTRLVRLRTRVETLKELLEKILEDEDDMKAVHLTAKLREQTAAAYRRLVRRSLRETAQQQQQQQQAEQAGGSSGAAAQPPDAVLRAQQELGGGDRPPPDESGAAEVEMLLEAYYMHLDSTWNRLTDIAESFDDVEELMDLEMDNYRNNILRMKVFLGACHLVASAWWAVANIFGMNLGLTYDDLTGDTYARFVQVSAVSAGAGLLFMLLFTLYLQRCRLALTSIKS